MQETSKKVIATTVKLAEETEKADLLLSALGETKTVPAVGF